MTVTIFGEADDRTIAQIERCQEAEDGAMAVLCADNHLGYSQPIGGVVAYRNLVSPSGVGYDIGCGNWAVRTNVRAEDIDVAWAMDEIVRRISFGMGRGNGEPADHPVLDAIKDAAFAPQRQLYDLAAKQLGTVGSGNHYVDLFSDEDGWLWVGVHFGSRGFGHKTATGFLSIAAGGAFDGHAPDVDMDSPPVTFAADSAEGEAYIEAMQLAAEYAYAGREVVVATVLDILAGARVTDSIHNHHNYAWREKHHGETFWVVRKGCTPAFPGQRGFVGATMGEDSVILEGAEGLLPQKARSDLQADSLFSTVHGAGRVMSRTAAKGKMKRRKRWECNSRDCDYSHTDKGQFSCPDHPEARPLKRFKEEQIRPGVVDWDLELRRINAKGIELRGAAADEAPPAYKRLDTVLAAHAGTINILHRLTPIGVAMAGPDTHDPFRD